MRVVTAILLAASPCFGHAEHSRADSVEGQAMAEVLLEYHRLTAAGDTTAFRALAPAYSMVHMGDRSDPRTWRPSGGMPVQIVEDLSTEPPIEGYVNTVEVLHTRILDRGGLVLTHEVGSYLDGSWDSHNVWLFLRIDGAWKISASMHDLPAVLIPEADGSGE